MATLLKTNGEKQEVKIDKTNAGPTLRTLVGGWIEIVRLRNGRQMIVDEEGHPKNKNLNVEATLEYHSSYPETTNWICGDVVILERKEALD
jgi:uncharacterized protein DUF3846